jgi:hypothetical protein
LIERMGAVIDENKIVARTLIFNEADHRDLSSR